MSAEAPMSVITGSAISPAMGSAGRVSSSVSFGPKIGNTGNYKPEYNNVFSETFALAPSLESFQGDRNIPDISPFNNTQILWQAPQASNPEPAPLVSASDAIRIPAQANPNNIFADISQSVNEATHKAIAKPKTAFDISSIKHAEKVDIHDIATEPITRMDQIAMSTTTTQLEMVADVKQAVRVQDALIAMGSTRTEARKITFKILNETETKKGLALAFQQEGAQKSSKEKKNKPEASQKKSEAIMPVRDDAVNERRVSIAMEIAMQVVRESDEEGREPTGNDLFIKMPTNPQKELVSGIAERGSDGSYYGFREDLGKIKKINPYRILPEIQNAMENNSAVENGLDLTRKATQDEVDKVRNGRQVTVPHA